MYIAGETGLDCNLFGYYSRNVLDINNKGFVTHIDVYLHNREKYNLAFMKDHTQPFGTLRNITIACNITRSLIARHSYVARIHEGADSCSATCKAKKTYSKRIRLAECRTLRCFERTKLFRLNSVWKVQWAWARAWRQRRGHR